MTKSFRDTLYLFSCGARGTMPVLENLTDEIDLSNIYKQSVTQAIWPTVFLSIKRLYEKDLIDIEKQLFEQWNTNIMFQAMQNTKRSLVIHDTITLLEKNMIECCMLKGETLARLYHTPSCRISGDTDILIDETLENLACDILKENGYDVKFRSATSHHTLCFHPIAGLLELHVHLYDELFIDVWFDKRTFQRELYRKIKTPEGNIITTLGITDGLIFVFLHLTKHFLSKGVGIRQAMDLILYIEHYKDEIEWNKFEELIKYLKYDKFFSAIINIGINYLGSDKKYLKKYIDICNISESVQDQILLDIKTGGIFGANENIRKGFYQVYTKERFKTFKNEDYNKYMSKWQRATYIKKFSFAKKNISMQYKYVNKYPILLPIGWINHFFYLSMSLLKAQSIKGTLKRIVKYETSFKDTTVIEERMNLIRELEML